MQVALLEEAARLWCFVANTAPIVAYRPALYKSKAHSFDRNNRRKPRGRKCQGRVHRPHQLRNNWFDTTCTPIRRHSGHYSGRGYCALRTIRKGYLRTNAEEEPRLRRGMARYAREQLHRLYPHENRTREGNREYKRCNVGERRHRRKLYGHYYLCSVWSYKTKK